MLNNVIMSYFVPCSYVISDHLCPKLKVSITPRHLPEQLEQPVGIIKSPNPHCTFSRGVSWQDYHGNVSYSPLSV